MDGRTDGMRCVISYKFILVVTFAVYVVSACTSDDGKSTSTKYQKDPVEEDEECLDKDGDGYAAKTATCSTGRDCDDSDPEITDECYRCVRPAEGCPCEQGQPPISCHLESTEDESGQIVCHEGTRFCQEGKWTDCQSVRSYFAPSSGNTAKIIDPDAGVQRCSACNVNCYRVTDMLDPVDGGMITGNAEGGVECADGGGLTLSPIDAAVDSAEADAEEPPCTPGASPDIDCDGIPDEFDPYPGEKPFETNYETLFYQIGPGQSETKGVEVRFYMNNADIYFLLDQTGSMSEERENLKAGLTSGTFLGAEVQCADTDFDGHPNNELKNQGIVGSIRCLIRDAWFGTGFHRELPFSGYGDNDEVIFRHFQDITGDIASTLSAIMRMTNDGNIDWTEGHTQALWSVATGNGLYLGYDRPGVAQRGDCPAGTWGYPCFRQDAIPIVVLFTDAPFHNGPDANFDYPETFRINRGTSKEIHPVASTNEAFDSAYSVGDITDTLVTYSGDTRTMSADLSSTLVGCGVSSTGRDAVFRFSLSSRGTVILDSSGTDFDTVISLHSGSNPSSGRLACDDDSGVDNTSRITSVLDPGTYYVVFKGYTESKKGPYQISFGTIVSASENETHLSAYQIEEDMADGWFYGSGDTSVMSEEYQGSVIGCGAHTDAHDAVFRFELLQDAEVSIDTSGSSYDTVISLHGDSPPLRPAATAVSNTNDTVESAYAIGDVYNDYKVFTGNTSASGITNIYTESQIGCSANSNAADAVYSFTLSEATRVRIDTEDSASGFDTVIALFDEEDPPVSRPTATWINRGGDTKAGAYNVGTIDGRWKIVSGDTYYMADNWGAFGCSANNSARDAFIAFSLDSSTEVTIDTINSSFDTVIGVFEWDTEQLRACDQDSGGNNTSRLTTTLDEGSYFVIVKGDSSGSRGYYELSIRDNALGGSGSGGSAITCNNDGGIDSTSVIETDLDAGSYYVVVKGNASDDEGAYRLTLRDVTNLPDNRLACSNDYSGSTSRIEESLGAGSYYVVVKGDNSSSHGNYSISISSGSVYEPIPWSSTLGALQDNGIRVMSVLSCRDDPNYGNNWNGTGWCDKTRNQAREIATETDTLGAGDSPLVLDINSDGSGLSLTVVEGIQTLADYLSMNVGLRVVFEPDDNPGFVVNVEAVDEGPGDGCEPPIDITHQNCLPGATPNFRVTFENPLSNPVPLNPDPNKDGYDFRVELIGNDQYLLDSIPVYVIPEEAPPPPETYDSAAYWQDITGSKCIGNTRPDWHDLTWLADLPSGTSIEFDACASDDIAKLDSCTFKKVASVTASGACTSDSDCPNGRCASNNLCQFITGPDCASDSDCLLGTSCVNASCVYQKQPADAAIALGAENLLYNLRMRITLRPDTTRHNKPTLTQWSLSYECPAMR